MRFRSRGRPNNSSSSGKNAGVGKKVVAVITRYLMDNNTNKAMTTKVLLLFLLVLLSGTVILLEWKGVVCQTTTTSNNDLMLLDYCNGSSGGVETTTDSATAPTKVVVVETETTTITETTASASSFSSSPHSTVGNNNNDESSSLSSTTTTTASKSNSDSNFVFPMEFPDVFTIPKQYDTLIHPPYEFTNFDRRHKLPTYKELNYTPNILSTSPYDISFQVIGARTPIMESMEIHAGVIDKGTIAHSPHVHDEEEILIILDNEFEELHLDESDGSKYVSKPLKAGSFIYYPVGRGTNHTVRNPTQQGTSFLLFKYISKSHHQQYPRPQRQLRHRKKRKGKKKVQEEDINVRDDVDNKNRATPPTTTAPTTRKEKIQTFSFGHLGDTKHHQILSFPTQHLGKLVSHYNTFRPGQGYDEHQDEYDIGMILLQGSKAQLTGQLGNHTISAPAVLYLNANQPHSMRNVGTDNIHLLVFEFQQ